MTNEKIDHKRQLTIDKKTESRDGTKGEGCPDGLICLTMKTDEAIELIHSITGNNAVKMSDFNSFQDACDWVLSEFAAWKVNSVMTSGTRETEEEKALEVRVRELEKEIKHYRRNETAVRINPKALSTVTSLESNLQKASRDIPEEDQE